ncbi:MAG TPA: hypothetical protein VGG94_01580 [Chthoniobacterales bacterium]
MRDLQLDLFSNFGRHSEVPKLRDLDNFALAMTVEGKGANAGLTTFSAAASESFTADVRKRRWKAKTWNMA